MKNIFEKYNIKNDDRKYIFYYKPFYTAIIKISRYVDRYTAWSGKINIFDKNNKKYHHNVHYYLITHDRCLVKFKTGNKIKITLYDQFFSDQKVIKYNYYNIFIKRGKDE